ncbi:NACHT domain-containing protein [Nodosilinea sp. LEGE 06152]|uniref:NACHT domain-containing protein n=1 Tax=Nodosilinea sp. LEGE 06152 TaxID=2777966 RepID=UPI0018824685|nr:NACHT domain-containing protein [Nodosilinea sp. LEGE 06152]MBE9157017.1 NACHT domain-containing protein [Nodosilinea sp. LEGE 06152]
MSQARRAPSASTRLRLVQTLNALPPTQFEEIIFALQPPGGNVPGNSAPQGARSAALLEWVESPIGPGLSALEAVLASFLPDSQQSQVERALLKQVSQEVYSRLDQSLHRAVLIDLAKEEQSGQVSRPWVSEVKIGSRPFRPVPAETTLFEVFTREDIDEKLLILGVPGSGKTTSLLDLAKELVSRAEQDQSFPIPVLVNLSSWKNDRQSIPDWLVEELNLKYGVSVKIGKELLERRRLLPLLDGLDELEPWRQEPCVELINAWLGSDLRPVSLAVCSRLDEYNSLTTKLKLNGCVCLHVLTDEQIQDYLVRVGHTDLWPVICQDRDLLELVRVPFWLSILVLSSSEFLVEEWKHLPTAERRLDYLLSVYVAQMLSREIWHRSKAVSPPPQTLKWLGWLASQLDRRSQDEFLIEQMQPDLLRTKQQRWIYQAAVALIFALLDGLLFTIIFTPSVGLIVGVVMGLIVGISDRAISTYRTSDISTVETFKVSFLNKIPKEIWAHLKHNLVVGLGISLVVGLVAWASEGESSVVALSLLGGMAFGMIGGLVFGLIGGLRADIQSRKVPNQGIWASLKNVPLLVLLIYPAGVMLEAIYKLIFGNSLHLLVVLIHGFAWALVFASGTSGKACIQHVVLRILLYLNGRIPWDYAHFLNICTDRLLLQRIGGRYRFIHRLAREHLTTYENTDTRLPPSR